jgi:hypothetical protein
VHINSGIPNHAAYLLATAKSREVVEKIWYRTLYKNHVGSQASFVDMAEGTMTACDELVAASKADGGDCVEVARRGSGSGCSGRPTSRWAAVRPTRARRAASATATPATCRTATARRASRSAAVDCPMNAIEANGQCFCMDGYKPNADFSKCVRSTRAARSTARGTRASRAASATPGFEGTPNAADGKCEAVASDCPDHAHPEWPDPEMQDNYICACNENFEDDGNGGCEVTCRARAATSRSSAAATATR